MKPRPGNPAQNLPAGGRYRSDAQRWQAVAQRDGTADGHFCYAVVTTGIYCRPGCPSRLPRRENVTFYATSAEAEQAGFRPCRRCHPEAASLAEQRLSAVARACELMEKADEPPGLAALAQAVGMSPFYFHRVFKEVTGLTPKAYARAHRARRMRDELPRRRSVTEAIYDAGYNSNGRFYAEAGEVLGMTASRFRKGGVGETIRFAVAQCSLGAILVAASARGVCAVSLGDDPDGLVRELQDRFPRAELLGGDREFEQLAARVIALVESPGSGQDLPLDIRGTAFQQRVWQALGQIPAGSTVSYAGLAERIGAAGSARAVAQACAANTLAVVVPCHRVVRTDGSLSGYRWGVERKRRLLERESAS
ncbi:bifunctional DNA-binding transcriptional regulator/O6-methylguanine-DNA methyltransferase Ada [Ruficoccus amylovorans]|uniref:methylated-DNA--[protein]-cysteine S-methyltransferase n=1 Tax=Ruficoccus amylovorans TaxID=1804625 RepID=A0A842HEK0_9BACT|nr:bifunctional DNA-binding transcriptional regulator/O6-methylguanine-DNA methyltransferase Ada [Ruficoccus amylovorans]MBC2594468.1 bifunctional DNA-binding transcriptional regulator/O6-methylguanine-DNA methyltransferase Ada [Ruficoccus amylovorans]